MKRFSRHAVHKYLAAASLILSFATTVQAQDDNVPFLLSEDEKLDQTDLNKAIPKSKDLQGDLFLNAPMTRMEYILSMLEKKLNSELNRTIVQKLLSGAFEYSPENFSKPLSIKGYARYSRETGHITVGYRIEVPGRPKRPMRNTCDELLSILKLDVPQENLGYLLHNTVLGVLAQEDFDMYSPVMQKLAQNIVHRVILQSQIEDLRITHEITCQRTEKGARIQYYRHSFKLP